MPPIISELIKFTVAHGFERNFAQLRKIVVSNGVKEQYYGTCTDTPNTLLWVIRAYSSSNFLLLECSLILNERMACG
jgi:hypothetical protein